MARPSMALSVEHLTRQFGRGSGRQVAISDLSFQIPRGTWTTVTGPPGSGKTVLFECLAGLALPDHGRVTLYPSGHSTRRPVELTALSDNARAKLRRDRIGVMSRGTELIAGLSVRDNILVATRLSGSRVDRSEFSELCDFLGLSEVLHQRPERISAGMRQRVRLARALLTGPELILADEPTSGIGRSAEAEFLELCAELVATQGLTLVVFSSQSHVAEYGTRALWLRDGSLSDTHGGLPPVGLEFSDVPEPPVVQFASPVSRADGTRVTAGEDRPRC